ncbi:acyl-CoA reductase [Chryseobacterium sp. A321]
MALDLQIQGLAKLGEFIQNYLDTRENLSPEQTALEEVLSRTTAENSWFTKESLTQSLSQWASVLNEPAIKEWLSSYKRASTPRRVGLILAGNIPLVGFHDVICVLLSGHFPVLKLSSKDKRLLPFLLTKWNEFSQGNVSYELTEKLENFDAVIATGSNNTARYLEYYFKEYPSIIRKNRTSLAVVSENDSDEDLQALGKDVFSYFGLGCRNVTYLLLPEGFKLERIFENLLPYSEIINHNGYANNYDYNKAIYLLNQDLFWDNNFVMLRESPELFSPLSVLHFSTYKSWEEAQSFLETHKLETQCVVSNLEQIKDRIKPGEAQNPTLAQYADHVDTMAFLEGL